MNTLTITRPDDWHVHLRDGAALISTVSDAARNFARAMVMPNLPSPVVNTAQALSYRKQILDVRPSGSDWQALMTLYLTDNTTIQDITEANDSGLIYGIKYYPAGATTNSAAGVSNIDQTYQALERMQEVGMPLQIHGEVTDPEIDIFDREAVFIDRILAPLTQRFPDLKIILEHVTTQDAVQFVMDCSTPIAATITPQHLLFNRNHLLAGGIRPHFYCLPILKRDTHQKALVQAATSGNAKFFLGTDSAPHSRSSKESPCGCAGCYSHHAALELYTEAFHRANALDKLQGFASHFGADFYGLPRNIHTVTLRQQPWHLPQSCRLGDDELVPLYAGEQLQWQIIDGAA